MLSKSAVASVAAKLARSRHHLSAVEQMVQSYYRSGPYSLDVRKTTANKEDIFLTRLDPLPTSLAPAIGDTIHNLRSILDHIACALVSVDGSCSNKTYFPVAETLEAYNNKKRGGLAGASAEAIAVIDQLKPYRDGNELIWQIHKLDNIDKHRTLLVAGSAVSAVDLGAITFNMMRQSFPEYDIPHSTPLFIRPYQVELLKVGDAVLSGLPPGHTSGAQVKIGVIFAEPSVANGIPAIELLQQMCNEVERVVHLFS